VDPSTINLFASCQKRLEPNYWRRFHPRNVSHRFPLISLHRRLGRRWYTDRERFLSSKTSPPAKRSHGAAVIGTVAIVAIFLYAVSHNNGPSTSTAPRKADLFPPLRVSQWRFAGRSRRR
jgi:hypothetical protein